MCQIHAVFLNFHNKVVDPLLGQRQMSFHDAFVESQCIVRWNYQYLVLNDYLLRIVGAETWSKVFIGTGTTDRPAPQIDFYVPHRGQAYLPVEFSVAAFRFGHSVRPTICLISSRTLRGNQRMRRPAVVSTLGRASTSRRSTISFTGQLREP
ncbi:peroxidase family protein [Paraburkholderia kirstenboschensis]|uniref:peroxidase family protein n=1 Tax=Paraburkholderia kirstenboschensis TaxID=1245436 RepID=UPI0039A4FD8C